MTTDAIPAIADPNFIDFAAKGSSALRSARFDPATGIVDVLFANGKTYRYANLTPDLMKEWGENKSGGHWFHNRIRQQPSLFPQVDILGKPIAADLAAGSGPNESRGPGEAPPVTVAQVLLEQPAKKETLPPPNVTRAPKPPTPPVLAPTPKPMSDSEAGLLRTKARNKEFEEKLAGKRKHYRVSQRG